VGASGGCGCWWGMVLGVSGVPRVTLHELRHAVVSVVV